MELLRLLRVNLEIDVSYSFNEQRKKLHIKVFFTAYDLKLTLCCVPCSCPGRDFACGYSGLASIL